MEMGKSDAQFQSEGHAETSQMGLIILAVLGGWEKTSVSKHI